jgi:hypothetical protein
MGIFHGELLNNQMVDLICTNFCMYLYHPGNTLVIPTASNLHASQPWLPRSQGSRCRRATALFRRRRLGVYNTVILRGNEPRNTHRRGLHTKISWHNVCHTANPGLQKGIKALLTPELEKGQLIPSGKLT